MSVNRQFHNNYSNFFRGYTPDQSNNPKRFLSNLNDKAYQIERQNKYSQQQNQ